MITRPRSIPHESRVLRVWMCCVLASFSKVGDGFCNGGVWNTPQCNFDGGAYILRHVFL